MSFAQTPLHIASAAGHDTVVQVLLRSSVALHHFLLTVSMQMLLSANGDPAMKNSVNKTALDLATNGKHHAVVDLLIDSTLVHCLTSAIPLFCIDSRL